MCCAIPGRRLVHLSAAALFAPMLLLQQLNPDYLESLKVENNQIGLIDCHHLMLDEATRRLSCKIQCEIQVEMLCRYLMHIGITKLVNCVI